MKPIEAFYFTMQKVNELKESGITVNVKPTKSRTDKELAKKYDKPERIPAEHWVNVSFKIENKEQALKIRETANYLGLCGIRFDTGGCSNCRDWELDWSFSYKKGEEDWEWRDAREEVEDMISKMSDGENI